MVGGAWSRRGALGSGPGLLFQPKVGERLCRGAAHAEVQGVWVPARLCLARLPTCCSEPSTAGVCWELGLPAPPQPVAACPQSAQRWMMLFFAAAVILVKLLCFLELGPG